MAEKTEYQKMAGFISRYFNVKGWPWGALLPAVLFLAVLVAAGVTGILYLAFDVLFKFWGGKEPDAIRGAILMITAALAASGIPFFIWRTIIAQQQSNTADRQAEIARDRAYTELFTKAIEQLGAEKPAKEDRKHENGEPYQVDTFVPNIEVRIGAIYALERIMKDSDRDADAIVDTIAAYIRENCGEPEPFEFELPLQKDGEPTGKWLERLKKVIGDPWVPEGGTLVHRARNLTDTPKANRSDVVTALKVLAARPARLKTVETMPDLRNVNFQCADLVQFDLSFLNLRDAQMQGTNLREAQMRCTDLAAAQMQAADLSNAEMQGANLNHAQLHGVELHDAKMQGADLSWAAMQGAELRGARMQGADLNRAKLDATQFINARKTAASVKAVDFSKAMYGFDALKEQLSEMFGHKTRTMLPDGMAPPDHWSEAHLANIKGTEQYLAEWEAFKQKMGVE